MNSDTLGHTENLWTRGNTHTHTHTQTHTHIHTVCCTQTLRASSPAMCMERGTNWRTWQCHTHATQTHCSAHRTT